MSNGRFSHNLNMEIMGPLHAQISKLILVISLLFSTRHGAGSAPNLFITGEYKQQIYVLYGLLTSFFTAQCHYIANHERMHHLPTKAQQGAIQPQWVVEACGGGC